MILQEEISHIFTQHHVTQMMILRYQIKNFDFILVSPVLESHTSYLPLGWDKFSTLSKKSFSPTLALGGMKLIGNDFMNTINNNGFGLSGIRLY